ncbi:MAG TPA: CHASE3 domain-containing protein [Acetobacteraceae bacterium]|nr:CHASE3 domain-containing protein [Acetobacteraceae bacterium]
MRSESLRSPAILMVGALAVLGCALIFFVIESGLQQGSRDQAIQYSEQVIGELRQLQLHAADAESGQRGYLLTGDPGYLAPFDAAPAAIDAITRHLRTEFSGPLGDQIELVRLDQITRLAETKFTELSRTIDLERTGQRADALALVRSNAGLFVMGSLRDALATMVADETRRLAARLEERKREQDIALAVSAGGGAFAMLMMLAASVLAVLFMRANRTTQIMLQSAHDAAVSADRAKSQFLATASHDLRQPLHAMNLFISALRRRVSGEEATKLVANMASAAESMQMMFNSLLDVSKLHAGAIVPAMRDFPVEEVLARLRNAFAASAAAKGIDLDIAATASVVHSDPVLLESILGNLVSNAVRYTRQGRVSVQCHERDDLACLEIRDTGPGIPADQIERAFEEFQRLDTSNAAERGLGLGLAIVRRLARLLDLQIEILSEVGEGTAFTVIIPRVAVTMPPETDTSETVQSLAGHRVLLVDDDPLVRAALAREIADWGARITVVGSAEAALWALGSAAPDVAIVDRDLGEGTNGIELLALLRARFGDIPAIIVTGATDPQALDELRRSGTPWMTKPLDAAVLRSKVTQLLAKLPAMQTID